MRRRYKKFGSHVKRKVDNKMRWHGDYDEDTGKIRINKKKSKKESSVINTILHEEYHRKHPNAWEKTVYKKTTKLVKKTPKKEKKRLYGLYQKKKRR